MTIYEKAYRLYVQRRVRFRSSSTDGEPVRTYRVVGDSDLYTVRWGPFGFRCTCPARTRCSHEEAVFLYAREEEGYAGPANVIDVSIVKEVDDE